MNHCLFLSQNLRIKPTFGQIFDRIKAINAALNSLSWKEGLLPEFKKPEPLQQTPVSHSIDNQNKIR